MISIGIDIGVNGAIAILFDDNRAIIHDMPAAFTDNKSRQNQREVLVVELAEILRPYADGRAHAVVEKVQAFKGQGVVSMFSFGRSAGVVAGALAALRIPFTLVSPHEWVVFCMPDVPKAVKKGRSLVRSMELFPDLRSVVYGGTNREKDGRGDALMMAWYCQQEMAFGHIPEPVPFKKKRLVLA